MTIMASRHFSRPPKLAGKMSQWKLGEVKPFFVTFKHSNETQGRSDLFNLFLFEDVLTAKLRPLVPPTMTMLPKRVPKAVVPLWSVLLPIASVGVVIILILVVCMFKKSASQ